VDWDDARKISIQVPTFPLQHLDRWSTRKFDTGIATKAWQWLDQSCIQPLLKLDPAILRRLKELAGGFKRRITLPSIGRDGGGTDHVISRHDPHICQVRF
jgi:hypothetical protein